MGRPSAAYAAETIKGINYLVARCQYVNNKGFPGKGRRGCHRGRRKAGFKKSGFLFLLLSQKRIQRFNDDTGNCRVVL